jgi:Zn-dependent M16 (insulinase) family peptidase
MGGAYGGFARFGESSGRFTFMSYRDPNLSKTLDVYDSAPEFLKTTEISDEDILQTIIGCTGYDDFITIIIIIIIIINNNYLICFRIVCLNLFKGI